jgi:hypothetical protein
MRQRRLMPRHRNPHVIYLSNAAFAAPALTDWLDHAIT